MTRKTPTISPSPLFTLACPMLAFLVLACLVLACGGGGREDPILMLSAEEALEQGKALMAQEKFGRAQPLLTHAFEVEPNSQNGREALLLAADALYLNGGSESYIKCEAKYRDFLNRFPTSERADYAQFQIANCLAERVEKPDRDQKVTYQALAAYEELMRLYPTSPYSAEARTKIGTVNELLANHELIIGHFYVRFRVCEGAIQRLEFLEQEFPNYAGMDKVFFNLGLAYDACNRLPDAEATFEKLAQRFPDSEYLYKINKSRKKINKQREKNIKRALKRQQRFRAQAPPPESESTAAEDEESTAAREDDAESEETEGEETEGEGGTSEVPF